MLLIANDDRPRPGMTSAMLYAKLKWEAACERLAFALDAGSSSHADDAMDLEFAIGLARSALEEVRTAFNPS